MGNGSELSIGAVAPGFELPDTDGEIHALGEPHVSTATVVFWTCNHCPYALAWHDRLLDIGHDYIERDVR
ncbi:MAG: redoxin, partial [Solirubrobacterales bacterium]